MDMQGKPIGQTGTGSKVTNDPASKDALAESTGAVASDSLAAESSNSGGAFSTNRGAPQDVSGSKSTLNNTDTSGATVLEPTPRKSTRDDASTNAEGTAGLKYPEGAGGQGDFPGSHTADGYAGGPSRAKQELDSDTSGVYQTASTDDKLRHSDAPLGGQERRSNKGERKDASGDGFDNDPENNASFNSEIGSDHDPSRQAIKDIQKKVQSASGGTGPRQSVEQEGTGVYDTLDSEQEA